MKVINSNTDLPTYQKIFKQIESHKASLVVWQLFPSGERKISECRMSSFHLDNQLVIFEAPSEEFDPELPAYFYSEGGQFIFKAQIKESRHDGLIITLPFEMKLLDDADADAIRVSIGMDISTIWRSKSLVLKSMNERTSRDQEFLNNEFDSLSLDEEDKLFADKRESPRARPKIEKWVRIVSQLSDEVHYLKLFDLSRGGIGFITMEPHLFPKGTKVKVVGFEDFNLDDPMFAQVMSQRAVDDTEIEFKIGCKFDEGQD